MYLSEAKTVGGDMVPRLQTIAQSNPGVPFLSHGILLLIVPASHFCTTGPGVLYHQAPRDRGFGDKIVCATVDSRNGLRDYCFICSVFANGSSGPAERLTRDTLVSLDR
jgi:hypothetical protein